MSTARVPETADGDEETEHHDASAFSMSIDGTVILDSAAALRDVARAKELVASEKDETVRDLARATVTRVPAVGA